MRSNSGWAVWLALFMLLLVGVAAVFFLLRRNTELETTLQEAEAGVEAALAAADATRDQLQSNIAVRQAALDAASATRDALAAEADLRAGQNSELQSSLAQEQAVLAEAQATLQALAMQVAIIAPAGDVPVPPLQPLEIIATARADAGLDYLSLTVNGQQIARLPAEGQNTLNVRASWTPPEEGDFVIAVEAVGADSRSETAEVTINSAYASDEAREAALRDQLHATAAELRFPEAPDEAVAVAAESASGGLTTNQRLHRQLLTGRDKDDPQAIADEAFVLQALGLIDSEAGYRTYLDDVVAADLLGFYDPDARSLTLFRPGDEDGVYGRWLGIHNLAHDLQAERFGLDELDLAALDADRLMAVRALVEGDAVFLQEQMLAGEAMPAEQEAEIRSGLAAAAGDITITEPVPLQEHFEFAYSHGVPFIQALHDQGGFDSVDGAWRQFPASSEQILHPERYLVGDLPRPVPLAPVEAVLGQGWRLVADDTFGEFLLRQHLGQQPLTSGQIDLAANGWGGGRYAVYQFAEDDLPVVVFRLAWDGALDGDEFTGVYADYLNRRYGGRAEVVGEDGRCWQADGVACLFQAGEDSLVVRAPNMVLALAAAEAQPDMSQP